MVMPWICLLTEPCNHCKALFFYLYLVWGAMRGAMTFANKSDSEQFNTNKNLKNRITKPNTNIWKIKRQV